MPFEFSGEIIINWVVDKVVDHHVLGRFVLNIDRKTVGNPDDSAVLLTGCYGWIKQFLERKENRFEEGLFEVDKLHLYSLLVSGVLVPPNLLLKRRFFLDGNETYANTLERFHISHIGMSSFDLVTLLLVQDRHGNSRLVWQAQSDDVEDAYFRAGVIEAAFTKFLNEIEPYMESLKN